jgi:hypothetical protein
VIELILVLLIGNLITSMRINDFECNSKYVGDKTDGDVGIIYTCNYAQRMEYSKERVLERSNPPNP